MDDDVWNWIKRIGGISLLIIIMMMGGCPWYNVYSAKMEGEAALAKANQEKQIIISHALAEEEAAAHTADAIRMVGEMAQKYPEYRYQEYMKAFANALEKGTINQIIYVPTEAGLPVTEASRFNK